MLLRVILSVLTGTLLIFFQACSVDPQHATTQMSLSFGKGCDSVLRKTYAETYYKTFRANCTSCHDKGGESGRFFAAADFDTAFNSFNTIGRATIEAKAQNPGHKPPRTGPQHTAMILNAQNKWLHAEEEAIDCSGGAQFETLSKGNNAIFANSNQTQLPWNRITWNLRNDFKRDEMQGQISMEISMEVRRYRDSSGAIMGYEFRNPRAKILDDGNASSPLPSYLVRGISLLINDNYMSAFTLFGGVDYTVTQTTDELIAPNGIYSYIMWNVNPTDKFGLRITSVTNGAGTSPGNHAGGTLGSGTTPPPPPPLPDRITFADLTSGSQRLAVFQQSCRNCHNATNMSGGLNLEDYNAAVTASANIVARMNNADRPMPPNGLLATEKREIVRIWVNGGTPQN